MPDTDEDRDRMTVRDALLRELRHEMYERTRPRGSVVTGEHVRRIQALVAWDYFGAAGAFDVTGFSEAYKLVLQGVSATPFVFSGRVNGRSECERIVVTGSTGQHEEPAGGTPMYVRCGYHEDQPWNDREYWYACPEHGGYRSRGPFDDVDGIAIASLPKSSAI